MGHLRPRLIRKTDGTRSYRTGLCRGESLTRFRNLLLTESDADRRTLVTKLLAEEHGDTCFERMGVNKFSSLACTFLKTAATQAKVRK
jgi:hypothetical protein